MDVDRARMVALMKASSGTTGFKINNLRNEVSYGMSPAERQRSQRWEWGRCEESCALGKGLSPALRSFSGLWDLETGLPSLTSFSRKPSALCEVRTAFLSWRSGAAAPSLGAAVVRCSASGGDAGTRVGARADPVDSAREAMSAASL